MGQLKMFGKDLEIHNNPALKSMWGDLMGEVDTATKAHVSAGSPPIDGIDNHNDFKKTPTGPVYDAIFKRFPTLQQGAINAVKELEEQRLPAETIVVRGDFVSAQAPALYGYRSSRTFRIS